MNVHIQQPSQQIGDILGIQAQRPRDWIPKRQVNNRRACHAGRALVDIGRRFGPESVGVDDAVGQLARGREWVAGESTKAPIPVAGVTTAWVWLLLWAASASLPPFMPATKQPPCAYV